MPHLGCFVLRPQKPRRKRAVRAEDGQIFPMRTRRDPGPVANQTGAKRRPFFDKWTPSIARHAATSNNTGRAVGVQWAANDKTSDSRQGWLFRIHDDDS